MGKDCNLKYLELLGQQYPTAKAASAEIINLRAKCQLPKGTEHFISDLHAEHEAFLHILRNCSGVIKLKVDDLFGGSLPEAERRTLCTLIYYPKEKLQLIKQSGADMALFYEVTMARLLAVCRLIISKYTREKVRAALPPDFGFLIDELIYAKPGEENKKGYYAEMIRSIIELNQADGVIEDICYLIRRISVDRLHIIGDIYDRGPGADIILDALLDHHSVDIQWGNHDILWMGAAAGNEACIANVVRICSRYDNLHTLEDGYGISTRLLLTFAMNTYKDDPCTAFIPKESKDDCPTQEDLIAVTRIHKAISVIQFKLEGQLIARRPEYGMERRNLLDKINWEKGTVQIGGTEYPLNDTNFPTVDPADPYRLNADEEQIMQRLTSSFLHSEKLKKHMDFLFAKGDLYKVYNGNLLFHGCIPMDDSGEFEEVATPLGTTRGKGYFDCCDRLIRQAYFGRFEQVRNRAAIDYLWYLWCGPKSPLFGKDQMTTFERYFIDDKATWKENKNSFYKLADRKDICIKILEEFGLTADDHIISGHVPVSRGDSPVRANGRRLVIDGGFSRAYQKTTGIAGYTLIYNSNEMRLVSHEPFESMAKAIEEERDIHSTFVAADKPKSRRFIAHTEEGEELGRKIDDLTLLVTAYREGTLKERTE